MSNLDSVAGCMAELQDINKEVVEFGAEWAENSGKLKQNLVLYTRLHRAAILKSDSGLKVAERDATAHAAVEQVMPGLSDTIEGLEYECEKAKTLFRTLERRSENARSILSALKAETRMGS